LPAPQIADSTLWTPFPQVRSQAMKQAAKRARQAMKTTPSRISTVAMGMKMVNRVPTCCPSAGGPSSRCCWSSGMPAKEMEISSSSEPGRDATTLKLAACSSK
jgi:hypothetical protein